MKYMLLIHDDYAGYAGASEAEMGAMFQNYIQFSKELAMSGKMLGGDPLQPPSTATTVRFANGKKVTTDGPYAETKEQMGGYYIIEAKDLDEVTDIAAKICSFHTFNNVAVEVRPVMVLGS